MKKDVNICAMVMCPLCKNPKQLLINARFKKDFPEKVITGPELCEDCKKKLIKENKVVCYEAERDFNNEFILKGPYVVIPYEILAENTIEEDKLKFLQKERFAFCDKKFIDKVKKLGEIS